MKQAFMIFVQDFLHGSAECPVTLRTTAACRFQKTFQIPGTDRTSDLRSSGRIFGSGRLSGRTLFHRLFDFQKKIRQIHSVKYSRPGKFFHTGRTIVFRFHFPVYDLLKMDCGFPFSAIFTKHGLLSDPFFSGKKLKNAPRYYR
jgi:hypothetical protein